MIHPTLGIRLVPPPPKPVRPAPPDPPAPEGLRLLQDPSALEFLLGNGFRLRFYPGLCIAERYDAAGRRTGQWAEGSAHALARKLGWAP